MFQLSNKKELIEFHYVKTLNKIADLGMDQEWHHQKKRHHQKRDNQTLYAPL